MKFVTRRIAENLLFAADIFILFLVLFENKMALPAWLQSVGRMHPMFLHFPIVILIMAMGMEYFRFRPDLNKITFYQDAASVLLLIGALSAAITVIMGLLLSRESGYNTDIVNWHKWMGLGIVAGASFVYWFRNANWYKTTAAKLSAVATVLFILVAGHLGADITHGDDFISAPLIARWGSGKVSVDKAIVYTDVIQPILKAKCMSCHNSEKAKGRLILDNPEDILKGGRHGRLFIARHADSSLIIQRINLPEDDKKHMPLTGKPQLTKEEVEVIYQWIRSGADFKKKLIELPQSDSLRIVASQFLAPAEEEKYDFSAADEKTIKSLSNNYRVVAPLAKESPALAVDFYNQDQFTSKSLQELEAVKKQIVELNLNKMPVTDADLKVIGQFENLRELNLSFTNITGQGLSQLQPLKFLRSLSVAGTKVNSSTIKAVAGMKGLRELFVWDTGLKEAEIAGLQKANPGILFVKGFNKNDAPPMQLNVPILENTSSVFTDTVHVLLTHPIPGVQIRYTLDGTKPDSARSALYNKDLVLNKNTVFMARAFKATWLGSDSIRYGFYKSAYKPDSISLISLPDDSHKGDGAKTLSDHVTGELDFGSDKWLGFQKDMEVLLQFIKPVKLSSVALHLLKNSGSDIYPPTEIQVWGGKDKSHLRLLKTIRPAPSVKGQPPSLFLEECRFPVTSLCCVKLIAVNVKKSPKWGNSPKKPGWIFTDEILLN